MIVSSLGIAALQLSCLCGNSLQSGAFSQAPAKSHLWDSNSRYERHYQNHFLSRPQAQCRGCLHSNVSAMGFSSFVRLFPVLAANPQPPGFWTSGRSNCSARER